MDVSVFTHGGSYGEAKNALEGNVTKAKSSPSMQSFDVPGSESTSLVSVNETETYAVCIEGSVFELNVGITSKDQCREYERESGSQGGEREEGASGWQRGEGEGVLGDVSSLSPSS